LTKSLEKLTSSHILTWSLYRRTRVRSGLFSVKTGFIATECNASVKFITSNLIDHLEKHGFRQIHMIKWSAKLRTTKIVGSAHHKKQITLSPQCLGWIRGNDEGAKGNLVQALNTELHSPWPSFCRKTKKDYTLAVRAFHPGSFLFLAYGMIILLAILWWLSDNQTT